MGNTFVMYENIIPLLAPADITSTATASSYMDIKTANRAAFLVMLGNVHSATDTDKLVVTVEAATAPTGAEASIDFNYRLSGAVGANTWGAISAVDASAGLDIGLADDNKLLWIDIDPEVLGADDYRYVRVVFTDTPDLANCVVGVVGVIQPKYRGDTFISATAAASA